MNNYLLKIEYDGSYFVGWQKQKNGLSVQETIEKAIKKILKKKIKLVASGRTDKGVHAKAQHANFIVNLKIENKQKFLNSLNFFLGRYLISVVDIKRKSLKFNSRYFAKERTYEYKIINRLGSLSLEKNKAWHIKTKLDLRLIKKGAKILEGTHDFSTFRSSSCSAKSPIKKLNSVRVKKVGDEILITFKSKSFLQNQVRSMVGSLKYLSVKKWDLAKFNKVLKSKNRNLCAPPAPAHGLYLKKVIY
tara:strand:+ start:19 stop:759 length:741 start_codon:yes stop_codon:yes gene_type:complete